MKKLIVLCILLTLVGCSKSDPVDKYGSDVLNVFNWGEYIGEDVIANFEEEYGVKVNYSLFDSNEIMYTKLLSGNTYDVIVPSDYMIERLMEEELIQPLDYTYMTNLDDLDTEVLALRDEYDDGGKYSIPYFWGTVGLVYNKNNVDIDKLDKLGWSILKDKEYAGRIFMYDSERDSFMVALKALGYSMNTENMDEINKAYEWLCDLHDTMSPAYVTDEVTDAMINNEKDIAVVYSGDAAFIISQNEDMGYYMPKEGTNVWSDGFVIPSNAKNPKLANEFINYMMSYDAAMDSSIEVGYTSANNKVVEELSSDGEVYSNNDAYIFDVSNPKNEVFKHNDTLKKVLSDMWVRIKVR
ncbi:MAG: ABC transporter substrate-binding protein [Erysipelotrichaceae bacterium]|nr:ABC transporter substrate-binding protein [Erysipelotrichaceae bacterium]